jgi:hypothetical protein
MNAAEAADALLSGIICYFAIPSEYPDRCMGVPGGLTRRFRALQSTNLCRHWGNSN